jgi:hypothetical protein
MFLTIVVVVSILRVSPEIIEIEFQFSVEAVIYFNLFWHPAAKLVEVLDVEAVEVIDCVIEFIFNEVLVVKVDAVCDGDVSNLLVCNVSNTIVTPVGNGGEILSVVLYCLVSVVVVCDTTD